MKTAQISHDIASDLAKTALSYYKIGRGVFFETRRNAWSEFQPAIGNLAIAVELLLKAIVAEKALGSLFTNLPDELSIYLINNEALPKTFKIDKYLGDLQGFSFKSIEFDQAVGRLYVFYPETKNRFKLFFANLAKIRNQSVHGTIPGFKRYELDRLMYLSTQIFQFVSENNSIKYFQFKLDADTKRFVDGYRANEIDKVKKAIESAQQMVKNGTANREYLSVDDWGQFVVKCPVCGSDAVCFGETEHEIDQDGVYLTFNADGFECDACGLALDDYDEMQLAGLDTSYARDSSYDIDRWFRENDGDPSHPYY